jgi:tetratricopeptide (TPR) repeat protein
LKGRYHWYKFTPEGYEKSLEYYRRAIDDDPTYALAYTGLADTYLSMRTEGLMPTGELLSKAEAATSKALQIDDELGEAHSSLASILVSRWQVRRSERSPGGRSS